MIFEKTIDKKKVYFKVQGAEHLPIHCHVSRKRNSWKENLLINLENISVYSGSLKNHQEILQYLKENPNFVEKLTQIFKFLNPKLPIQ